MLPGDAIRRFLETIGPSRDASFYLDLFREAAPERFAVIALDAKTDARDVGAAIVDVSYLVSLGLIPTLVFGPWHEAQDGDGLEQFRRRLKSAGVPAALVPAGDGSLLRESVQRGEVPLLSIPNVQALVALLDDVRTRRFLVLRRTGGFTDGENLVAVARRDAISSLSVEAAGDAQLLEDIAFLLDQSRHRMHITVTSPFELLRELFTSKGSGTMFRIGAKVVETKDLAAPQRQRFSEVCRASFGKQLSSQFWKRDFERFYVTEDSRGFAVVEKTPLGRFLTKFVVDREAQGEGVGRDVWERVAACDDVLFWRARRGNPICSWYLLQCHGVVRDDVWEVYWRHANVNQIPELVRYALSQPDDFS